MGGGSGRGLNFGATYGSGELPLLYPILHDKPSKHGRGCPHSNQSDKPGTLTMEGVVGNSTHNHQPVELFQEDIFINTELANAYEVVSPGTGMSYRFLGNSWIRSVRNIAGGHAQKELAHNIEEGLRKTYGSPTEYWTLREGVGTLLVDRQPTNVTIRWYESLGSLRVGFIVIDPL